MTTLLNDKFTCVFCGKEFKDDVIGSTNFAGGHDAEFRQYSGGLQPLAHLVHTCPFCGFTDWDHSEAVKEDKQSLVEAYLQKASKRFNFEQLSAAGKYEIMAEIFQVCDKPLEATAQIFLRAAWIADDDVNSAAAAKYRDRAVGFFEESLQQGKVASGDVPFITYLVGELNRRMGRFNEAIKWFSRVKTDHENLLELCGKQKELAFDKVSGKTHFLAGQVMQE